MGIVYALLLWKYQGWIIFGILVWLSWRLWVLQVEPWLADRRLTERAEQAALVLRADHENREFNEAGIYEGHYPGATMPLDEYDDGMTEWL